VNTTNTISTRVIQGGTGVAVSDWPLPRAVALAGQLGVVSGTALEMVCARRRQLGDAGGRQYRVRGA
jgi:NAD(P)H-dependent flavin oxidoreductase YrpB (nitropropane dioxygenase family)